MSPACPPPDPSLGIAVRMTQFLDCQARVLGENGYLSLATGPVGTALTTAFVTILVALIGYRLILGSRPGLAEGVGWTMRIGIALALLGSWPAFQTLIYRTATDGPVEVAQAILGPSGLPSDDIAGRVQMAYDTIRLGSTSALAADAEVRDPATPDPRAPEQRFQFQGAAPRTAVMFLVGTVGLLSAIRICIGFLLAIGPLPVLAIVLSGGGGLFLGWLRMLAGAALAAVAATAISAVELVLVESELSRLQAFRLAPTPELIDAQALSAIVFTGILMALVAAVAAVRVASKISFDFSLGREGVAPLWQSRERTGPLSVPIVATPAAAASGAGSSRERQIVHSLLASARRDPPVASRLEVRAAADGAHPGTAPVAVTFDPVAAPRRRGAPRRTRSALRREAL